MQKIFSCKILTFEVQAVVLSLLPKVYFLAFYGYNLS